MLTATKELQEEESDLSLVSRFRATKDMKVLGALWSRHLPMILAVSMKYLHNRDNAKDACSEVFLELNEKILRHDMKNFRAWLYAVVKNHCLQRVRREQIWKEEELDEKKIEQTRVEFPEFEHPLAGGPSLEQRLIASMEKLNPPQRRCLELFYFQEKGYKEIADLTGYALGMVKSHIQNGKRNLLIDLGPFQSLLS